MIQNRSNQDEEVQEPKPLTRIAVVAVGIAVATALHYFTSPGLILWHNLFQRLYYLPIIYAAIYLGWRGGLVASTVSALCYIPHILMAWHHMPDYAMNQYAEIIVFFLVGTVTGVLADREMKQRRELAALNREAAKLRRNLDGILEMSQLPDAMVIIDTTREANAVLEARRLGIPTVAVVDTNADPEIIDYPIAGNDDAIRAIRVMLQKLVDAVVSATGEARVREQVEMAGVSA